MEWRLAIIFLLHGADISHIICFAYTYLSHNFVGGITAKTQHKTTKFHLQINTYDKTTLS